jgi:hypothetical protein
MAVFEGQTRSLTPSFQNIQEALHQQATLAAQAPGPEDILTPIVKRLDQEFTKKRDFEDKLAAEGRQLFTPEMADQMAKQTGLPVEAYTPAVNRYYSPKEFQEIHDNAVASAAQSKLKTILTPKEQAVLDYSGEQGKKQVAEQTFPETKDHAPAHVVVSDPSSSTGFRYALINSDKTTTMTPLEAPKPAAGAGGTKGQDAIDKKFADIYADYVINGQSADVGKQLNQLQDVKNELKNTNMATGPAIGSIPSGIKDAVLPRAAAMQQRVEEVVQRNLRLVLGAQFTENEGKALIARAYNPKQPEAENVKRLDSLITQIAEAAQAKKAAVDYWESNGTLKGFKGKIYTTPDQFLNADSKAPKSSTSAPASSAASTGPVEVGSADEALKLPVGTKFKLNGKTGTVQ